MTDKIFVKGAKENNLKNIDVEIPRDKLVVFTGLSGSGKSSLAFDTIFAEGQRRYIESLSSYARMFLGQMEKPDVEYIEGLSLNTEKLKIPHPKIKERAFVLVPVLEILDKTADEKLMEEFSSYLQNLPDAKDLVKI